MRFLIPGGRTRVPSRVVSGSLSGVVVLVGAGPNVAPVLAATPSATPSAAPSAASSAAPSAAPVAVVAEDPPGVTSDGTTLADVDCGAPGECMAVGDLTRQASGARRPVAEQFAAGVWTAIRMPVPEHAGRAQQIVLTQVSCPTSSFCVAVGSEFVTPAPGVRGRSALVLETWDGEAWTVVSPSLPPDASAPATSYTSAVDCAGPTSCVAVGGYRTGPGVARPLALTYDGTGWTTQALPSIGANDRLNDISCAAGGACTAVGSTVADPYDTRPLVDTLSAGGWDARVAPLPADAESDGYGDAFLTAVSCTAPATCAAAGSYEAGHGPGARHLRMAGIVTLVDPGGLSTQVLPAPADVATPRAAVQADSIDCWQAHRCLVGGYANSGHRHHRRGTLTLLTAAGSLVDVPPGTTQQTGRVTSVDCTAAGVCAAVAESPNGISGAGAISMVSGGTATTTPAPVPAGVTGVPSLNAVALDGTDSDSDSAVAVGDLYVGNPSYLPDGLLISGIDLP